MTGHLTRTFDRRTFRVHLVNPAGRSVAALRYMDGKAEWPTGPLNLGDRFTASQAYAEEAQWIEALRNKGTGYRALAWPVDPDDDSLPRACPACGSAGTGSTCDPCRAEARFHASETDA